MQGTAVGKGDLEISNYSCLKLLLVSIMRKRSRQQHIVRVLLAVSHTMKDAIVVVCALIRVLKDSIPKFLLGQRVDGGVAGLDVELPCKN